MKAEIKIPGVTLKNVIGNGFNSVIYSAEDYLGRKVIVKLWNHQNYDNQWYEETKAMINAYNCLLNYKHSYSPYFISDPSDVNTEIYKCIVQVFFCGKVGNIPYVVMEYVDGSTLFEFIKNYDGPLGTKVNIARKLCELNKILVDNNIIHCDLRGSNVIITNYNELEVPCLEGEKKIQYDLKIIDYGIGDRNESDVFKSFQTLIRTINYCISPFNIMKINASPKPSDQNDASAMSQWIYNQIFAIRAAFFELGCEYVGWPLYPAFGTYEITTKGFGIDLETVKEQIRTFVNSEQVILNKSYLGVSENWDTFDGRYAKRGD